MTAKNPSSELKRRWAWSGAGALCLLVLIACKDKTEQHSSPTSAAPANRSSPMPALDKALAPTAESFWSGGPPSFIPGSAGSDLQDRRIRAQVDLVRSLIAPTAPVIADTEIELDKGSDAWPTRPVLYGRPDENALLRALAEELPFKMDATRLEIGGEVFEEEGIRLITVIPAQARTSERAGHPAFLLYAGTGEGGIAEINAGAVVDAPIIVADRFGVLRTGDIVVGPSGELRASLRAKAARRIGYRQVARSLQGTGDKKSAVDFYFPDMLDPATNEDAIIEACMAGLDRVVARLAIESPVPLSIYLYPDVRSKKQLTGNGGHGHALPSSRTLHMLSFEPAALEALVAHEGSHVLAYYAFGPPGSALMGEGLAVWVSGGYAGQELATWRTKVGAFPPLHSLLGPDWRGQPEALSYPLAGLLIDWLVTRIGIEVVAKKLYGASFENWDQRCQDAGLDAEQIDAMLAQALSAP